MWLLVARERSPDAPEWPGRHAIAAVDAVVWPLLWMSAVWYAPTPVGVVGPFVMAVAALCLMRRLHRALRINHRYRFTTWHWGKVFGAMLLMGAFLKLVT